MTLYELTGKYLMLLDMMDDPSVDEKAIADTMESLEAEIEDKADAYAKIIAELDGRLFGVMQERDRLDDRAKMLSRNIDRLKKNLKESMEATGKTKFKTPLFSFWLQESGPKIAYKLMVQPEVLPKRFRKEKMVYTADGDAIREYISEGKKSKIFEQVPRTIALRIK